MADGARRVFTQEEVNAILSRAVERQSPSAGGLTYAELVDSARQAGIPAEAIDDAIADLAASGRTEGEGEAVRAELAAREWKAKRSFVMHFTSYVMVMALLTFANVLTWREDHTPWVLFPALGWGIGLAVHFMSVLFAHFYPDPNREERMRKEMRKREEERRRREARGALKESAKELGVAVERGVATLLADVAKNLHEAAEAGQRAQEAKGARVGTKARVATDDPAAGEGREHEEHEEHEQEEGRERYRGARRP